MLTFSDTEEKAVEKAIAALADMIPLDAIQPPHSPALTFPGLEIRLHQRRVLKDGTDIYLTRLEYGALCYLAASPGRVFTKAQIFEAVWSMESESCQSNVANVICNLRKKIEPDSRRPTYIKTVLGIVKYFPDCYRYDEDELNRILSVALQTRECQQIISKIKTESRETTPPQSTVANAENESEGGTE